MKTNFPYTAIHQLLFFSFSDSGVSIFRIYLFIFHMQGVQKNQDFTIFLFFSNKAGVDAAEWLYRIRRRRS